jgi:hypothetical protein
MPSGIACLCVSQLKPSIEDGWNETYLASTILPDSLDIAKQRRLPSLARYHVGISLTHLEAFRTAR